MSAARAGVLLAVALAGCVTETVRKPDAVEFVPGIVDARWRVVDAAGATLGYAARTRFRFAEGESVRVLVENAFLQEVGYLDANGRVFRHVPFRDEPELVTTASLEDGVKALLRAPAGAALELLATDFRPVHRSEASANPP